MNLFTAVLYLHIATVAVSVGLFVLRYWWMYHQSPLLNQRWVRIAPHCSDTLLFLSGAGLMAITHYLPFTEDGAWLTEKLFGVIIYIALGFIALGRRRPRSQQSSFIAFLLALVVLFIIIQLAITRIPILG
ncbi:TPA: SirB family protein [Klebsiella pneumoniae]|uniref:invasion regulator SirB2 n=1 Tax=Klebsiella pneumoniae TaxID=573 RepID=UPI000D74C772|nr:invasion regulator SirB2 [Klebsiella pneumoniae]MBC4903485.1 SirB family protein [Klebsiella pneumoniae]MBC5239861.1 SirB family protein [Klebsiella pneumoniae]MDZ0663162.1 invasion regulator SirB2 [Klebsiella pneumoniae]MRE32757.1 SirB family protein [Klebsiella pneumoniae]MRF25844.1 SirB family protein [Klebsiella pneumoniae]